MFFSISQFIDKKLLVIVLFFAFSISSYSTSQDSVIINVISYNIQTGPYYQSDTPEKISKLLDEWNIDVFGTQELHIPHVLLFEDTLPDYGWFGVGRDDGKVLGECSAIFYRKEKIELLEQNTFWLSETPETPGSKSWGTSDTRIVTWGKFLLKFNKKVFFVFNTHYDHVSNLARIESSKLLRIKMREIAELNPIIITGDFNCSEDSSPYNTIVEEHSEDLGIFNSEIISLTKPFGPTGSYNGFNNDNPTHRIDFIFVNQYLKTLSCGVINEKPNGSFISDHFPVFAEVLFNFPSPPLIPTLTAIAGNNQINLSWDKMSEDSTYESFLVEGNDFQGYKLYRSRDSEMTDAELIAGSWNTPLLRKPLFVCDKKDGIYGYTNYGIIDGFGYDLGEDSGLQHYYIDNEVRNGVKFYYVLTAYDNGFSGVGTGFAPNECEFEFRLNDDGDIISQTKNAAVVTPYQPKDKTVIPTVKNDKGSHTIGNAKVSTLVFNSQKITEKITYKLFFSVDTLKHLQRNKRYRHPNDLLYVNCGFKVFRTDNGSLVYYENIDSYTASNIVFNNIENFQYLNNNIPVVTEEFNGIQITMEYNGNKAIYSEAKSGWINGNAEIKILPSFNESQYFPWQYELIFTDNNEAYTGLTNKVKGIRSHDDKPLGPASLLLKENFSFYVINKSFTKEDGTSEKLDLIVYDKNMDGIFDYRTDQVLVGHCFVLANQVLWSGTVFALDFSDIPDVLSMPKAGDTYLVEFDRPFMASDEILIDVDPEGGIINLDEDVDIPNDFKLEQNYPNPFNPLTTIEFSIVQEGMYSLKVYNIIGQATITIFNKEFGKGNYSIKFSSTGLSSGVYIYRLASPKESISKKMIVLK